MNKKLDWAKIGKKAYRDSFKDSDGDGVANVWDCEPRNKKKQGFMHTGGGAGQMVQANVPKPLPGAINPSFNQVVSPEVTKYAIRNPSMSKRIRRFTA